MKWSNILKVFKRDIKAIIKNPIALLIIGGICFIPSLYAWINIAACWDPYENTSTVPIAVVNNDKGASFNGKEMNVGDDVIDELKNNHDIGWKIVNAKQADMGLIDGTYYAMIEIPEDFSEDLTSVMSENPKKPEIIYKVNTKANPVAGKITEVAESTLVNEITSNFITTVNETIFSSLNGVGYDIDKNKENIIQLKNSIIAIDKNMSSIKNMLNNINSNSANLSTYLQQVQQTMPSITSGLNNISQGAENTGNLINSSKESLNNTFDNIRLNLTESKTSLDKVQNSLDELSSMASDAGSAKISATINRAISEVNKVDNSVTAVINFLEAINKTNPNDKISSMITSLKGVQTSLNEEKNKLNDLQNKVNNGQSVDKGLVNSINDLTKQIEDQVGNAINRFDNDTRPALNTMADGLVKATQGASDLLNKANGLVDQINNLLSTANQGAQLANSTSEKLKDSLDEFSGVISELSSKLQNVSDDELGKIVSILQSNPAFMGDFIANPFNIKVDAIYKVANYGSGMAPIYSVLALWVGSLILISLLKTESAEFEGSEKINLREKHFGKMMTFVSLGIIQGFIVAFGDKFLLGVQSVNTALLIFISMFASAIFTIIVFTLMSVFGNLGKALAIILMVLQLAGSGGSYPIQVDPLFFRIVQPAFPFTYAISGYREAIAGPLVSTVILDFAVLSLMGLAFILLGYLLKGPLNPRVRKFEDMFEESGIAE
ncbi:YhgE/Pip domain-containing protein [Clostridium sp. LIBA-8841]|uniref:YhgE/Pip domain-containing protein n=1 Tax=Clostridium sp. LIBA-8841 TaxID=2987530 RepID=UPI002AC554FC|nr:YhgE/Pip domain-containing protein [Clostridium sp. LIBA-8841]MDZ5254789.1 YhgE/Pip domain-containing protein [Clostridium sp. LIBA-8841]